MIPSLIPAFVDAVMNRAVALQAAAEEAAVAASPDALSAACQQFNDVVSECLAASGMPVQQAPGASMPGWLRRTQRAPTTSKLRRQRRRALSRRDYALAAALNRQICAAARRHKRQQKRLRGKELAKLARTDPAAFYKQLRGKTPGPDPSISTSQWTAHFESLLGQSTDAAPSAAVLAPTPGAESHRANTPATPASQSAIDRTRRQLHAPFDAPELCAVARRMKNGKAVLGALKPVLLKAALDQLAPALTALLNACVRIGCLPLVWAVSALTPIRKPDADHLHCDGYRGIAVGTLPAKLHAAILDDRIVSFTEAAGIRASGQAGFRKSFGCNDQQFAMRAIIERQRARGQRLYVCYVDFKQAFDRVPRHLLWQKLQRAGLSGWALQAVQALYANVPMCVRMPNGFTPTFQACSGVKQGCPLSPTLFGLYLDDFEAGLLQQADVADLPSWQNGRVVPPLFYADDQALLSVSAAGLRHQLAYLETYCSAWGLTVNTKKTKVVVYSPPRASKTSESFRYGSQEVETVPTFRYLGMHLHSTHAFASAAAYRAQAGRRAMHVLRRRLAEHGLHSPLLSLHLFKTFVLPVLSYGAEVWGPQLILQGGSACEKVHYEYLRGLLGVRDSTPKLTLLAETAQLPLAAHWTKLVARFANRLVGLDDSRVAKQAFMDNIDLATACAGLPLAQQPWAAQVGKVLDMSMACLADEKTDVNELTELLKHRHLRSYTDASVKVQRYVSLVHGGNLEHYIPARYLSEVPERRRRQRLAQLRTGSHWLAEVTGCWKRLPRDQRPCPHCHGELEDAEHMIFDCPLYCDLREQFTDLFAVGGTAAGTATRATSLLDHEDQAQVAKFVHLCHATHCSTASPSHDG